MTITDIIIYLREQLLILRDQNNRQAVAEVLATAKLLTRLAFESGDRKVIAMLVNITDSARDMYMGKPLNGKLPSLEMIRSTGGGLATSTALIPPNMWADEAQQGFDTSTIGSLAFVPPAKVILQQLDVVETTVQDEPDLATDEEPDPADVVEEPLGFVDRADFTATEELPVQPTEPTEIEDTAESYNLILKTDTAVARLAQVTQTDWESVESLSQGTSQQRLAWELATSRYVFDKLESFQPVLVGEYPLDLAVANSPLVILVNPVNLKSFLGDVKAMFSTEKDFSVVWKAVDRVPTICAVFKINQLMIEIWAQPYPVSEQKRYIQTQVIARLIAIGGDRAKSAIRYALQEQAYSLERAVADYFNLKSINPQQQLLELAEHSDQALMDFIAVV
ncbi:MAG: DUF4269 domain-containing protein [Phototrophicaceae bacterium]